MYLLSLRKKELKRLVAFVMVFSISVRERARMLLPLSCLTIIAKIFRVTINEV